MIDYLGMHVLIAGNGVVGSRLASRLTQASALPIKQITLVNRSAQRVISMRRDRDNQTQVTAWQFETDGSAIDEHGNLDVDVVVLATAAGSQLRLAKRFLKAGCSVLATSDSLSEVRQLLDMDAAAISDGALLIVGVGMAPGLSDVLVSRAAEDLDCVTEVHVAKFGAGGPACARQHHRALSSFALEWQDGWCQQPAGTGRELCWFPSPVDAADCYRAALADPFVLARRWPQARRISARMAATRRDRFSSWLPMLRLPHSEGKLGAVRVDVRGQKDDVWMGRILGATGPPASVVVAVLLSVIHLLAAKKIQGIGAMGLAEVVLPSEFLDLVQLYGVVSEEFVGG
ncbi:MAG: hypothetical protein F4138_07770 [Acidimicrobiia bacterium]|nr:hypothetical protein [Acidimicrobiia bacterium]